MKRIAAIMIASLFVLTAFAALEIPQNATVNHIPVPFPYTQSSPVKPYVATSNGLTYTVEPNGTYLWNGNYLRAPPVPYPNVPTIAPDGLPYGAVGKIGTQGQVGAKSFSKGTAQIIGVSPATTAGTDTLISANTFWGNETITLVGNVSIENGISLTIYNSNITFSEPASTTSYAYGFNVSYNGHGNLYFRHGTVVTQSNPSTTNSWFIWGTGAIDGYSIPYVHPLPLVENFTVISTNSTIDVSSNNTPRTPYTIRNGGWYYPAAMTGIYFTYFNYSTTNGYDNLNFQNSINVTVGAIHSLFENDIAIVGSPVINDTFNNSMVGFIGQGWGFSSGYLELKYDTIINETAKFNPMGYDLNPGIMITTNNPGVSGPMSLYVNNSLFENINGSMSRSLYPYNHQGLIADISFYNQVTGSTQIVENNTIKNFYSDGPNYAYLILGGVNTNQRTSWSEYEGTKAIIEHNSLYNITGDNSGVNPLQFGNVYSETIKYNILNGETHKGTGEFTYFDPSGGGWTFNMSYNIFENITAGRTQPPFYQTGVFNMADLGTFVYSQPGGSLPGQLMSGLSMAITPNPPYSNMSRIISHNFWINVHNKTELMQTNGVWITVENNTVVNEYNGTSGLQTSVNSGAQYNKFIDNSFYGVYNYSLATGSNQGGDYGTVYQGNTFYDVDITSFGMNTISSVETWNRETGAILLSNGNESADGAMIPHYGTGHTTKVWLDNSTFTNITTAGIGNSYYYNRAILPNDLNITIYDSYIPALWGQFNGNTGGWYKALNPFSFSNGPYTLTSPYSNSYFLNLTGYLGVYPSQTYTLNASNIKGESSLPVYLAGSQIGSIPASSAHYNLTASYSSGTLEYSVSANSASDQPISLMWNGQIPNTGYSVAMYDNGQLIDYTNVTSSANGVVSSTYNPATMPLDPVFELTTFHIVTSGSTAVPPEVFLYVLLAGGALLGAGAIIVAAVDRRRYR